MKSVKITKLYDDDATAADVEFTHDDDTTTKVERLNPIPLYDERAALEYLTRYEEAYIAGLNQQPTSLRVTGVPVTVGMTLTPPADSTGG